jgi:hypothetical protein
MIVVHLSILNMLTKRPDPPAVSKELLHHPEIDCVDGNRYQRLFAENQKLDALAKLGSV